MTRLDWYQSVQHTESSRTACILRAVLYVCARGYRTKREARIAAGLSFLAFMVKDKFRSLKFNDGLLTLFSDERFCEGNLIDHNILAKAFQHHLEARTMCNERVFDLVD